jgi:regulator of ribonuclease activity A
MSGLTNIEISTADIYDAYPKDVEICDVPFRNFGGRQSFVGPCSTLKVFEDHTPVRDALSKPGNGRVLVVDGGGSLRVGIVGDGMSAIAIRNGWVGIIVAGAIRDSKGINALDLAVKALGTTARRGWDKTEATASIPVKIGSVVFEPGNWVYADADCILVAKNRLRLESDSASS